MKKIFTLLLLIVSYYSIAQIEPVKLGTGHNARIEGNKVAWLGADSEVYYFNGSHAQKITTDGKEKSNLQLSEHLIAWIANEGAAQNIYIYKGGKVTKIPSNTTFKTDLEVSGLNMTWSASGPLGGGIFRYLNGYVYKLSDQGIFPSVSGNRIVYSQQYNLSYFNGSSLSSLTSILDFPNVRPKIVGSRIVWHDLKVDDGSGFADQQEIFYYNGTSKVQLTNDSLPDYNPQISGAVIIWRKFTENNDLIYWNGSPRVIGQGGSDEFLFNDKVIWKANNDLYYFDGIVTRRITETADAESEPRISNTHVVWVQYNETGFGDIYLSELPETTTGPYIVTPANNALNQNVRVALTSSLVENASSYTFKLEPQNGTSTTVITQTGGRTQTIANLAYNTTYHVSVKTNLSEQYGKITNLTTASAEHFSYLFEPANNETRVGVNTTIIANAVNYASNYTLELNTSPDFDASSSIVKTASTRSIAFTGLSYNTKYYARVKTDLSPNWGRTTSFTTGTPLDLSFIISPANNASNVTHHPILRSNLIPGATEYIFQISPSIDFSEGVLEKMSTTNSVAFSGLAPNTRYFARVATNLAEGWGSIRTFVTIPISSMTYVVSPLNGAMNQPWNINIRSSVITGASEYTIELNTSSDFTGTAIVQTSNSNIINFSGLEYNRTYYSRVKSDRDSAWGPRRSFSTGSPTSLAFITSPSNNAVNTAYNLYLALNHVPNATEYTVEVNTEEDFTGTSITKTSTTRSLAFQLGHGIQYFVRVKTNLLDEWGPTKTFTTATPVILSYVKTPANAASNISTSVYVYSNVVSGATTYTIELNTAADFSGTSIVKTSSSYRILFSGLDPGTVYYTRVKSNLSPDSWGTRTTSFTTTSGAVARLAMPDAEETAKLDEVAINISPNPFVESITVEVNSPSDDAVEVTVMDLNGKIVYSSSARSNAVLTISENLQQGVYLIKVKSKNFVKTSRIIKE